MDAINYDCDEIEDNIDEEYDDAGTAVAEYTTEPHRYGDLISQRRDGQSSFFHYDGLGSSLALTNASGMTAGTYAYRAFGQLAEQAGTTVNPFQYVGKRGYYRDDLMADHMVRQRWLTAQHGRWLSVDRLWLFDPCRNGYRYANNMPTRFTDPSGLVIEICCSPALVGPFFPDWPAAGAFDPDDLFVRLELLRLGIDPADLRRLNLYPVNHCFLKFKCMGKLEFTTEGNSDLYFTPGHDLLGPIRAWPGVDKLLKELGIPEFIPFGWLVRPLINVRPGGTCKSCVTCDETDETCASQKDCLLKQYESYPRGEYGWFSRNSNTYAGTVARACCDAKKIDVPGGVARAWGWEDTPNPHVPHLPVGLVWDILSQLRRLVEFVSSRANV